MKAELTEFFKYRELLYMVTRRDVTVRYRQSVMGVLWAVLMPLLIVMAGVIVRFASATLANQRLELSDVVEVAAKSIPWAFVVSSIRFACMSLVGNSNLVTKIYFPKEIFPLAAVASQLVDFVVAAAVLSVLLLCAGVSPTLQMLWIPLLVVNLVVLSIGISLVVSAGSLFFRDVKYIVEVFLTFGIFFTPVFYEVEHFGRKGSLLLLNPIAPILEGFGAVVAGRGPAVAWIAYSLVVSLTMMIAGYSMFKKLEPAFAESI
jgi:lipopolysaccharide transport system permease protein